jgi:serine/threonine protein kinase/tetratricopeptide (TPR) repeat protein
MATTFSPQPIDTSDGPTIAPGVPRSGAATGSSSPALQGDAPTSFVAPTAEGGATMMPDASGTPGVTRVPDATAPHRDPTGGPLDPGQTFGPRYHIIRALGVGGMGAVYQAWDDELGVAVAIKVIRPDVMADPTAAADIEKRFKRELLLARQVTHKNVVRIHDLGDINGIKYITMPYVDGADLSTVLKREGQLSIERVLRIARSVVSGLVEAHKAGVVHRDLKPANIMIGADDEAMIMDFGIARSTGVPTGPGVPGASTIARNLQAGTGAFDATVFGAVVGTVEYMAPEQAKGITVDQRADIYAFGLILHDLLVGKSRIAQGKNPVAELKARMAHAPPAVKTLVPGVPDRVDQIISRCLEPDADKRFQSSEELAAALALLDDEGKPIPIPPRFSKKMIAAAAVAVIALVTGTWWFTRTPPPPKQHDPVVVLIADFNNTTSDPTFDRTLEPMLKLALEGASFISAYDRARIRTNLGLQPPEKLDEAAAREIAAKQGLGVVLSGSIDRQGGGGFEISIKAAEAVTDKVISTVKGRAANKDQVLQTATRLVTTVRKALGDETSDMAQLLAMRSVSASSMEMVRYYAAAIEAQANGNFEEARQSYLKTVELDPNFALGYQGLATMSRNLGKLQDADKYINEALQHLDGITERERFAIRGLYYANGGDYLQCEKEFAELTSRYAADAVAHNNRAVCLSKLRRMREAADELRQAVQILPKRIMSRANLAMFGNYAGDFEGAEREVKSMQEPNDMAMLAVAFAKMGQGRLPEAAESYKRLETKSARGASWATSGMGDLALYEGRFSDAIRTFEQGVASDVASKNTDKAARKLTSLAYVHLLRGQKGPAIAAGDKALLESKAVTVRFLAARIFVDAGAVARARTIAAELSSELAAEPQAYGKIIEGEIALKNGDTRQAQKIFTDANALLDTWLGHFDLGRAYLELRAFPHADSEFDRCIKRRGEALALFFDEEPTFGYFPPVYYYQGLVKEGQKSARAAESFREYLEIRGKSTEDPLLPDVKKRAGASAAK